MNQWARAFTAETDADFNRDFDRRRQINTNRAASLEGSARSRLPVDYLLLEAAVMAVADVAPVRRSQSLWTVLEEIRPETRSASRREPSGRFQSRIEGIIAGLEELTILREIHRRLVVEATTVTAKKTTTVVTRERNGKTMLCLDDDDAVSCYE